MPARKRLEEEKKNGLLKASKSCFKVNELFKRQKETASKIASMPEEDLAVLTSPTTNVSSNNNQENRNVNGITNIIIPTESSELKLEEDINYAISSPHLTNYDKYTVWKSKYLIDDTYIFPQIENDRKFLRKWLDEYEWLVYSIKESGVFCKYCAIFANLLPKKRNLINQPKNKG